MRIKPFEAIRPDPKKASQVASFPYDVINTEEARELASGNPASFLHVIKPEIDLPPGVDLYSDEVYAKARENFEKLQRNGDLIRERTPCLYLYRQIMDGHEQTGVVTVCHVEDYEQDVIKKHENTLKKKEDDRARHVAELNANAGPVFLLHKDDQGLDATVNLLKQNAPLYDFTTEDDVQHTVWKVDNPQDLVDAFSRIPVTYVADGHHRSASAARVGLERKRANPAHHGAEEYNWFLAVIFPASQLQILPYNRAVKDLNGRTPEEFLTQVKSLFSVTENASPKPATAKQVSMYLNGIWYGLSWDADDGSDIVGNLDVSVLQRRLLAPVLNIKDPRNSDRIQFVGGIRGPEELACLVDSGACSVAFSMCPTSVEQLMAVADAGKNMPPKSTWFEPKLRSGLFVHSLD